MFRNMAEEERASRDHSNAVSEQYLVRGNEMNELRREIGNMENELQARNSMVNQLTMEMVAAQQQIALQESNQNVEILMVKRKAHQQEQSLEAAISNARSDAIIKNSVTNISRTSHRCPWLNLMLLLRMRS